MANYESTTISYDSTGDSSEPADMTFEQMYAAYYDMLVKDMRYRYQNLTEVEHADIVQDAMIKAMTHFDDYQDIGYNRLTWLRLILKRTAIDRIRRNKSRATEPSSDMREYETVADKGSEQSFANVELSASFNTALDHVARILTDREVDNGWYATFYLYAVEERQYNEIAPILGISEGTVKSRINRIRKRLVADAALREHFGKEPIEIQH